MKRSSFVGLCLLGTVIGCGSGPDDHGLRELESSGQLVQRIAVGSGLMQWEDQPVWNSILAQDPDLFIFLGDAMHAGNDGEKSVAVTEKSLKKQWNRLGDNEDFKQFRDAVPVMATWDGNDYGAPDGGAEFPLREASKTAFLDFFGEPKESPRRSRMGVYDAMTFGPEGKKVQVILLDTRYQRSNADLLGEEQWSWLEDQLRQPARVRLIASSTPVVPDQGQLQRLTDLIEKVQATGVFFLSGHVYYSEVLRAGIGPYPMFELTASGLNHVRPGAADGESPHRVAGPMTEINFGMLEIEWEQTPSPVVVLKAIGLDGKAGFDYRIAVSVLGSKLAD